MASGYGQDQQGFFQTDYSYDQQYVPQSYDMGGQFPQETQFGQFDYSQSGGQNYAEPTPYVPSTQQSYTGSIMTPDPQTPFTSSGPEDYENEPPLMEELGINFDHIYQKTMAVLNPLREPESEVMQDTDLAGPLVFCLAFGASLLLAGKVSFGYIYGIGVVGCIAMYALLNLMSITGVSATTIISVLGYCLLPMVILSFAAILMSLQGMIGTVLTTLAVIWCSISASKLFVTALGMDHQQPLVAYPCALVYGVFALLTVF